MMNKIILLILIAFILVIDVKRAGAGDPTPQPNLEMVTDNRAVQLMDFVASAEKSLYVAVYSLDYEPLISSLIAKHEVGLLVRVVVDGEPDNEYAINILRDAGITVKVNAVNSESHNRMHHKFIIVDGANVLMGSSNFTYADLEINTGIMYVIYDSFHYAIASRFNCEFNQLWQEKYSYDKRDCSGVVNVNNSRVHIQFSPHSNLENTMEYAVNGASNVMIETNWLTLDGLGRALLGVENLMIIYPESSYGQDGDEVQHLGHADLRIADNLHSKALVSSNAGRSFVWLGSANLSYSAEIYNDESIIGVIGGELADSLYRQYEDYFASVR